MNCVDNFWFARRRGRDTRPGGHHPGLTPCFMGSIFVARTCRAILGTLCLMLVGLEAGNIPAAVAAGELEQGQRLAEGLRSGEAVWLEDGQSKYFCVFNPDQSGQPKGGVIILHDANSHPDKPQVIRPLRDWLPRHGWATLAVQLPALDRPADYLTQQAIITKRINGAVTYMQNNGFNNLVLLGHGTGALAAGNYLSAQSSEFVHAFVAISMGVPEVRNEDDSILEQLQRINLPMLDIYGGNDLPYVTKSVRQRALAARASGNAATRANRVEAYRRSAIAKSSNQKREGYIAFRQIRIDGAPHDFSGAEGLLSKRIIGWLERHAKGVAVNR